MTPRTAAGRARMERVREWAGDNEPLIQHELDEVLAIEAEAAVDAVDMHILAEAEQRLEGKDWRTESKPLAQAAAPDALTVARPDWTMEEGMGMVPVEQAGYLPQAAPAVPAAIDVGRLARAIRQQKHMYVDGADALAAAIAAAYQMEMFG